MDPYDRDTLHAQKIDHESLYNNQAKAAPRMVSLADTVRGLEKQCECQRDDIQRLNTLLAETREELAMLSHRTFGQEPSR